MWRELENLVGAPDSQRHGDEHVFEFGPAVRAEQAEPSPFARLQRRAPEAEEMSLLGEIVGVRRFTSAHLFDCGIRRAFRNLRVMVTRNSIRNPSQVGDGGAVGRLALVSISPRSSISPWSVLAHDVNL